MESAGGGACRLMSATYNDSVVEWSVLSQEQQDFKDIVNHYH
jgi:hypothetical protein